MGDFADSLREAGAVEDLRKVIARLEMQLTRAKARTEDLVEATLRAAWDATLAAGPIPPVTPPKRDRRQKHRGESALWHLTDWQGAKITATYNSEVMRRRVMRFVEKARIITEIQRAHHPVRHCTIAFGGDMGEGLFNYPTQPFEIDATIFDQFITVGQLEIEVVRAALETYETVEVVAEWGNHGRIGSRRSVVPRADNFDRMTYAYAAKILEGERRLTWPTPSAEDVQRIVMGNYRALLIHGDEVGRNGFASPMTIVRHADRWASGAYRPGGTPWHFRDVYVGHYHTHNEWAMANGEGAVYQTGSTESDNRYAMDSMAASATPSQRLHFIDTDKGRVTATYKVYVDD